MQQSPLLEAEGLTRDYGALRALDAVSLRLRRGEVLGLLGPNGAGKTTAMRLLCGTLAPSSGSVTIDGIDLLESPRRAKRALGYLPEHPPLYPEMSVRGFLGFAARLRGLPRERRTGAVAAALARTGTEAVADRPIAHLSLGYRQRVGIAQAIVHEPPLLILDEPTVGLDPIQIREIRALIAELGRERGVILSTHILPEVQMVCSRVAILHHGRIAFEDSLDALRQRPVDALVIALERPPERTGLEQIPGVIGVEPVEAGEGAGAPAGRFRVTLDDTVTSAGELARHCFEQGWSPSELTPQRRDLEQIFVEVTASERAPSGGAASAGVRAA